jgi:hypothetical protein
MSCLDPADRVGHGCFNDFASLDGGNNWSYAKLDKPIGKWAWVGWSFTWEDATPGEYTLRCRAKDERGNMSKDDDSEHDYYAMDITKAQYVDVNVYPSRAALRRRPHGPLSTAVAPWPAR